MHRSGDSGSPSISESRLQSIRPRSRALARESAAIAERIGCARNAPTRVEFYERDGSEGGARVAIAYIAVAGQQSEDVDVILRVTEVDGVHDHVDVGAVLAAHSGAGYVDELDPVRVEVTHIVLVVAPVAVGALEDDPPLFEQALQDEIDLECATRIVQGIGSGHV